MTDHFSLQDLHALLGVGLSVGDRGEVVTEWQRRIGCTASGVFCELTERATRIWQTAQGLPVTGTVGRDDWAAATNAAPRPMAEAEKAAAFGSFRWEATTDGNIRILGDWAARNLVTVECPQLASVPGIHGQASGPHGGRVLVHRAVAERFLATWAMWDAAGLLSLVLTWDGMWAPRFVRGRPGVLSSHARATAFDINARWNGLGKPPAPAGATGSVVRLVPIARENGWFWGGDFDRPDGMHLEAAHG